MVSLVFVVVGVVSMVVEMVVNFKFLNVFIVFFFGYVVCICDFLFGIWCLCEFLFGVVEEM